MLNCLSFQQKKKSFDSYVTWEKCVFMKWSSDVTHKNKLTTLCHL